ncbi:MAG: sel1 repeat family protein [Magnetococcales bacterium]|nr:sel1 repeat family protein [Magnetococcales bacterium]
MKSAEQGFADAQSNLGKSYMNGFGVTQDYRAGVYWLQKAAEQGLPAAQIALGVVYGKSHGVAKNKQMAVQMDSESC